MDVDSWLVALRWLGTVARLPRYPVLVGWFGYAEAIVPLLYELLGGIAYQEIVKDRIVDT